MLQVAQANMIGKARKKLDNTIREASNTNTKLKIICNQYIPFQNIVLKLTGVSILIASIGFHLNDTMELLTAVIMMIMSFIVFSGLESMGAYSSLFRVVDLCVNRDKEVLDLEPMDIAGDRIVPQTNNINVSDIDFAYDKKKIIDDVSLCIPESRRPAGRPPRRGSARPASAHPAPGGARPSRRGRCGPGDPRPRSSGAGGSRPRYSDRKASCRERV